MSGGAKDNAALAIELTRDPAALTFSARKENKFIEVRTFYAGSIIILFMKKKQKISNFLSF